jgi:WhiB family transcriptional regulator, redox-sensing transcriptional regulator
MQICRMPEEMTMTGSRYADVSGWAARGACRHSDPELFFPVATHGPALEQVLKAKVVCRSCPVQGECLEFALETGQDFGVWGGASEAERRLMRRRRLRYRRLAGRNR